MSEESKNIAELSLIIDEAEDCHFKVDGDGEILGLSLIEAMHMDPKFGEWLSNVVILYKQGVHNVIKEKGIEDAEIVEEKVGD